ncbi:MAG: DUF6034 family protein [Clostridiales bacterium]|nr:DUF6034 family protein [Clostridiales bacterium]
MKRTIALLIAVLMLLPLLSACQPTPKDDFVVNKGDDTLDDKLNATPAPEASPDPNATPAPYSAAGSGAQLFPDHWDAEPLEVKEGFTIGANADVVTKADGIYPVYRVKDAPFTREQLIPIIEKILGKKPVMRTGTELTKDYYIKELELFLKKVEEKQAWIDAGRPPRQDYDETEWTDEEIDEMTRRIMEDIANAPDEVSSEEVTDFSGLKMGLDSEGASNYLLEDGTTAYVFAYKEALGVAKNLNGGTYYREYEYESDKAWSEKTNGADPMNACYKLWKKTELSLEEAEAMLNETLALLGLEDFYTKDASRSIMVRFTGVGEAERIGDGWLFKLVRNPGGYPQVIYSFSTSIELRYDKNDYSVANARIHNEEITVFFTAEGLRAFSWVYPKEITGVVNPNVSLLSFDEAWDRVVKSLTMSFPLFKYKKEYPGRRVLPLEIWSMTLTTYLIRIKDSDEYYAIPCWVVFYDGHIVQSQSGRDEDRYDRSLGHDDVILINAVDGSMIYETSWAFPSGYSD